MFSRLGLKRLAVSPSIRPIQGASGILVWRGHATESKLHSSPEGGKQWKLSLDSQGSGIVLEGPSSKKSFGDLRSLEGQQIRLSPLWLRDNCLCSNCVNSDTQQRNFDTFKISPSVRVEKSNVSDGGHLSLTWSDGHTSFHPSTWLARLFQPSEEATDNVKQHMKRPWDAEIAKKETPLVAYGSVVGNDNARGMAQLMKGLHEYGFALVHDTPVTPDATERLLETIGPVRNTHYGGFYDFIPDLASADTAYTNLALAAHTDTTYFSDPAGLQSFHMLSHHPPPGHKAGDAESELGGQSLLVDGLRAAEELRENHPEDFEILRKVRIPWHASGNADASITPDKRYPVIETSGDEPSAPISRIRWNNDDRGVVPLEAADEWYRAARRWDAMLKDSLFQHWFQLQPGIVLIFDNWRVLHGRSAFEGVRRICGAYINRDDFHSRWKLSCLDPNEVKEYNLFQTDGRRGTTRVRS